MVPTLLESSSRVKDRHELEYFSFIVELMPGSIGCIPQDTVDVDVADFDVQRSHGPIVFVVWECGVMSEAYVYECAVELALTILILP